MAKAFGADLAFEDPLSELELPTVDPPWTVTARIWDEEGDVHRDAHATIRPRTILPKR